METTTGVVGKVFNRGKMWSLQVGDEWYGNGFDEPACKEGEAVEFNWDSNTKNGRTYKNISKGSIKIKQGAAPSAPSYAPPASPGARDVSIQYQSSRKDALVLFPLLVEAGAISLPKEKAAKYDAVLALVEEITNKFYIDIQTTVENGGVDMEDMVPTPEADGGDFD